jgi:hypothetical protein
MVCIDSSKCGSAPWLRRPAPWLRRGPCFDVPVMPFFVFADTHHRDCHRELSADRNVHINQSSKTQRAPERDPKKHRHGVTALQALDLRVTILFGAGNLASQLIGDKEFKRDYSVMPNAPSAQECRGCAGDSLGYDRAERCGLGV